MPEKQTRFKVTQFSSAGISRPRFVSVPSDEVDGLPDEVVCDRVFAYGQSEYFPTEDGRSVAVGDIVDLGHALYLCKPTTWSRIGAPHHA